MPSFYSKLYLFDGPFARTYTSFNTGKKQFSFNSSNVFLKQILYG